MKQVYQLGAHRENARKREDKKADATLSPPNTSTERDWGGKVGIVKSPAGRGMGIRRKGESPTDCERWSTKRGNRTSRKYTTLTHDAAA